jgi:nucleotide-binding universal stress UspA family protein
MQGFARLASGRDPEIRVVASMSPQKGAPLLKSSQQYLEDQGFKNVRADLVEKSIIEASQDTYIEWADLCVLGASSKSAFEKMLLGSFPKKLILDGHIPLFIST